MEKGFTHTQQWLLVLHQPVDEQHLGQVLAELGQAHVHLVLVLVTEQVFDQLLQDAVASCQGQFLEGALQQLHTLQRILCEGKAVHQEPLALEIEGLEECIGGHRVSGERLI